MSYNSRKKNISSLSIEEKIYSCLNKYNLLESKNVLALAFSSGSDSSTLLDIINEIRIEKKIDIILIHVNYNLRGSDSLEDKNFAINKANELGIKIFIKDVEIGTFDIGNLQQHARDIRYQYFQKLYKQKMFTHLLMAHNKDDYLETILYKLIKGSSTRLAHSFKEQRGYIIRPMLTVSKNEINEYIKKKNLPYRKDKSNESNKYARNKIRNTVLPIFESISNKSMDNIINFVDLMDSEIAFLEKKVKKYYKKHTIEKDGKYIINIDSMKKLNKIIAFRIIARFLSKSSNIRITKKIIEECYKIIISKKPNITINIADYKLEKSYDFFSCMKNNIDIYTNTPLPIEQDGEYNFYDKTIYIKTVDKNNIDLNDGSIYLDIAFPFIIRTRKQSDIIYTYPNNQKKSLRKIFIDLKIPSNIRDKIPIIEYNDEIAALCIRFYLDAQNRISNKYSINKNSNSRIIKISSL